MSVFDKNDWLRRVGLSGMKALRALVNTWNLYVPIRSSTGCSPYNLRGKFWFTDRRKRSQSLLIVLAGYREQVWKEVFERVERHVPADMDVCLVTSGARFEKDGPSYTICPIRFSIGAILFSRATWKDFGMFPVVMGTGMGEDESHLCSYCMSHSKVMVVAENTVVGHLGFGPQTAAMLEYYRRRRNA